LISVALTVIHDQSDYQLFVSEEIRTMRGSALARNSDSGANLNLWKKRLGVAPESVWEQTELETLVLADNDLKEISSRIGALKKLRMLDLGHNQLSEIPESIGDLSGLTDFLYLHDNRLKSLPAAIGKLGRLRELHLRNNRLSSLPGEIGLLPELRLLDLRGNPIAGLPKEIAGLPKLEKLDLRWVTTLDEPAWFGDLEARGCVVYR
jgi:Leucine-rich repeat (LRR) protein